MAKNIFLFAILLFSTALHCCDTAENIGPASNTFVKLYGRDGNQFGVDIKETSDNNFVLLAMVENGVNNHFMLIKIDSSGNEIWMEEYLTSGASLTPVAMDIDNNDNIVVTGTYSSSGSKSDIFVYLVDPGNGEVARSANFNINDPGQNQDRIDQAEDILFFNDAIVVTGNSRISQNDMEEFFSIKIDHNLEYDESWTDIILPTFDPKFRRVGNKAINVDDSKVLVLTTSDLVEANSKQGLNVEIMLLNQSGAAQTGREFLGTDFNDLISGIEKTLAGYAYIGTILESGSSSILVGELSSAGTKSSYSEVVFSSKKTNNSLLAADIGQLQPGRLVILAEEIISGDNRNIYLAEIDLFGQVYWELTYGGDEADQAGALLTSGSSIYVIGTLKLDSQNKVLFFKTNGSGHL